jgi:hypothetical protein
VEFAIISPVHPVSQNDLSVSVVVKIKISVVGTIISSVSLKMMFRQAILTVFPSNGLAIKLFWARRLR